MSYRNRELEYHLTPLGWTTHEIAPSYTVETWRLSIYQEFSWSKPQYAWRRVWHNMAWSESERERFRLTFPMPDQAPESPPSAAYAPEAEEERKRA
jgi:hypothetical protein